jgi:hypothetical protein
MSTPKLLSRVDPKFNGSHVCARCGSPSSWIASALPLGMTDVSCQVSVKSDRSTLHDVLPAVGNRAVFQGINHFQPLPIIYP